MAAGGPALRLVGGPASVDATVTDASAAVGGVVLAAFRPSRWCLLADLRTQVTDRETAEQLASAWMVARYEIWGRPRRLRPQLYRHTGSFALVAARDEQGRWSLEPGSPHLVTTGGTGRSRPPSPDPRRDAADRRTASTHSTGPRGTPGTSGSPDQMVWARLEDDVDRAAQRFARVAALLPSGALADRAQGARRSVDACVGDAARLCAVGTTVSPDWQPGSTDEEATSLVSRVASLLGTIDAATRELVRLHLELGDPEPPAEDLALLAASVAELEAATHDRNELGAGGPGGGAQQA
jgi:hypothetical protein